MDGILPAAGLATRLRGLPKFALPISESFETLFERQCRSMLEVCERVWVPVNSRSHEVLSSLRVFSERVIPVERETITMTESVLLACAASQADNFVVGMPDTFFFGPENIYALLCLSEGSCGAALFPIRETQKGKLGQVSVDISSTGSALVSKVVDKDPNCSFPLAWGAIRFDRQFLKFAEKSDPHIGYALGRYVEHGNQADAVVVESEYFDCGTPHEYWGLVGRLT